MVEEFELIARLLLIVVFGLSGAAKLRQSRPFADALTKFHLAPQRWVPAIAVALPIVELACAIGLVAGLPEAAYACVSLLVLFTLAISIVLLLRDARFSCGCFGALANERLTWLTVGRNLFLLLAAFGVATAPAGNVLRRAFLTGDELVPAGLIVAALVLIYAASIRALGLEMPPEPLAPTSRAYATGGSAS